jgi:hypothetical protein
MSPPRCDIACNAEFAHMTCASACTTAPPGLFDDAAAAWLHCSNWIGATALIALGAVALRRDRHACLRLQPARKKCQLDATLSARRTLDQWLDVPASSSTRRPSRSDWNVRARSRSDLGVLATCRQGRQRRRHQWQGLDGGLPREPARALPGWRTVVRLHLTARPALQRAHSARRPGCR